MFFSINDKELYLYIIILLLGGIISLLLYQKIKNIFNRKIAIKRSVNSRRAETKAERWLKRNGFKILDRQQSKPLIIKSGSTTLRYLIRIDFLVKKNGHIYVVEVKSGAKTKITNRETRRQLLEYFLAYQPYGIILFDMENKKFSEIRFMLPYFRLRVVDNIVFFLLGALFAMIGIYFFCY